jgi:hypothetical protein
VRPVKWPSRLQAPVTRTTWAGAACGSTSTKPTPSHQAGLACSKFNFERLSFLFKLKYFLCFSFKLFCLLSYMIQYPSHLDPQLDVFDAFPSETNT